MAQVAGSSSARQWGTRARVRQEGSKLGALPERRGRGPEMRDVLPLSDVSRHPSCPPSSRCPWGEGVGWGQTACVPALWVLLSESQPPNPKLDMNASLAAPWRCVPISRGSECVCRPWPSSRGFPLCQPRALSHVTDRTAWQAGQTGAEGARTLRASP